MKLLRLRSALTALVLVLPANSTSAVESTNTSRAPGVSELLAMTTADLRRPDLLISPVRVEPSWSVQPTAPTGWSFRRTIAWGAVTTGAGYYAYRQSQASWGVSTGRFHFKDDLHDGLAMSDESSHLFTAYHLTQALYTGYAWTGLSNTTARRLAAAHAWLWAFSVEYPVDAYNPTQGFGVSDLAFNTLGVLAAYEHTRPGPDWWDIKISIKPSFFADGSRLVAYSTEQYDDFIYWLTIKPSRSRYVPLWLGAGYSTNHRAGAQVDKEMHLGIGTTLEDLAGLFSPSVARYLRPASAFFLNLNTKLVWH